MPQFVLDMGSAEDAKRFNALDEFTQGYVEALFFTDEATGTTSETWNPETDSNFPGDMTFADLALESLARIVTDCARFQKENAELLADAYAADVSPAYDAIRAGRDFWFSRQGHGVGYWDRDLGATGDALHDAAKQYSQTDSYLGDDGKVYV